MIKTVFFDLGNVLISFSHDKMWKQLSEACQVSQSHIQGLIDELLVWTLIEKGEISTDNMILILEKSLGRSLSKACIVEAVTHIFEPIDTMKELLEELKNQAIQLILISNTCDVHFEYVKKQYPFVSTFDHFVLSYELKLAKPDIKIYSHALSLTTSKPEECLYVDDIEPFVVSAQTLGIHGHVFKSPQLLKTTLSSYGITV